MPLGIVNDEEFEKELGKLNSETKSKLINTPELPSPEINKDDKCAVVEYVDITKQGRNLGDNNVPGPLRRVIVEERLNGATVKEIKNAFPISGSSVHAYSNGATSTAHDNNSDDKLAKFVNVVRTKITKRASRLIIRAMDAITDDKINDLKANEISILAKNMSSIMKDIQPTEKANINNGVVFQIYRPEQKSIDTYDVVEVGN